MAVITDLPPEIWAIILSNFYPIELLHLRQTCKRISAQASPLWIRYAFKKHRVMFEKRSLEALVSVAEHPALGPSIECLYICSTHLLPRDELKFDCDFESSLDIRRIIADATRRTNMSRPLWRSNIRDFSPQLNEAAYRQALTSQEELIRTGSGIQLLTKAVKKLVNCKKIYLSDKNQAPGFTTMQREIGIDPQQGIDPKSPASIAFIRYIMHALSTAVSASNLQIKEFGTFMGQTSGACLSPDMLARSSATVHEQTVMPSVEALMLKLEPDCPEPEVYSATWATDFVYFTQKFPGLSKLTLEMRNHDVYNGNSRRPDSLWFSHRPPRSRFAELSPILHVPALQAIDLCNIDCMAEELALFLTRHSQTIRKVELRAVNLVSQGRSWSWLIELMRDSLDLTLFHMRVCMKNNKLVARVNPRSLYARDNEGFGVIISQLRD